MNNLITKNEEKITEIKALIRNYFKNQYNYNTKTKIKRACEIKSFAQEIETDDKWINKFRTGEIITNRYGKHLYFKFGE